MFGIIFYIITMALAAVPCWLVARFNMHMFQLNGYLANEQFAWLKENARLQWLAAALMILGIIQAALPLLGVHIVTWLFLILTFVIYRAMKRIFGKKKPLHFTTRVKRMFATNFVLVVLIIVSATICMGFDHAAGVLTFVTGAQVLTIILANAINKPAEAAVKQHYINDAKRILESCDNLTIIGITGSYGKTSMKFYLQELLEPSFNVLVTPESYNTPMGIVKTIRESLTPAHEIFICEMGARYVGDIKEICDIVHPDHGVITSIGPAHLMTFGSLENTQKTKFELADALPAGGKLFLNADSELVAGQLDARKAAGINDNAILFSGKDAEIKSVTSTGTDFAFGGADFHTRLVGEHNVINIVGALTVAHEFGARFDSLRTPVRKISSVPHRMELKKHGEVTIIDDAFNSNPVGSKAAVETLALFDGVRIMVTPGMVELGEAEDDYNYKFGTYAAPCCDWIVLVGKSHTAPIKQGALDAGFPSEKIKVYNSFEEAINFAYTIPRDGKQAFILLENDLPDNYYSVV